MKHSKITHKKDIHIEIDEELTLRILRKEDITKKYISWLNQSEVMKLTEQNSNSHDQASTQEFVDTCFLNEGTFLFGIFFKRDHIGNIKLGPINFTHQIADVSYVIGDRDFWGRGIATIVIKAVVNFGFNERVQIEDTPPLPPPPLPQAGRSRPTRHGGREAGPRAG